jgi:hypothetical protein
MAAAGDRSERVDQFRALILERMKKSAPGESVTKAQLVEWITTTHPELCNPTEPCYKKCRAKHPRWRHLFDRAVYDLTQTTPRKLESTGRGVYRLSSSRR